MACSPKPPADELALEEQAAVGAGRRRRLHWLAGFVLAHRLSPCTSRAGRHCKEASMRGKKAWQGRQSGSRCCRAPAQARLRGSVAHLPLPG